MSFDPFPNNPQWESEIVEYVTSDGKSHKGEPELGKPLPEIDHVFVHAWNPEDHEDDRYFWVHHPHYFRDWQELLYLIDVTADQTAGVELA